MKDRARRQLASQHVHNGVRRAATGRDEQRAVFLPCEFSDIVRQASGDGSVEAHGFGAAADQDRYQRARQVLEFVATGFCFRSDCRLVDTLKRVGDPHQIRSIGPPVLFGDDGQIKAAGEALGRADQY